MLVPLTGGQWGPPGFCAFDAPGKGARGRARFR
jgi:hypothetical protein